MSTTVHTDVIIIGAGLSGIGAAVHLQQHCPGKQYVVLEARHAIGGTWDLFRYPGIRSDSDMFTLGYKFKPWTNPKAIADGESIREYIQETAREYRIEPHIRFNHKVVSADWCSRTATWTLQVKVENDEIRTYKSNFVICCAGYYKYDEGFTPDFPGRADFRGQIIHPQHWPENLDYTGKRVVVIGSGATAVTLVPAMTDKAAHVTMLQRSPSYVAAVPEKDHLSNTLRRYLPESAVYHLARTRNIMFSMTFYNLTQQFPEKMKTFLLGEVRKRVGESVDMKHFTPAYNPWDQRLCAVPNGDLFKRLREGKASVVTDQIERFTAEGIVLKSGQTLEADIIITATGLQVQLVGGMTASLDGQPVNPSEKLYYKGAMIEDVPNFAMVFGYTNSSWTLKADLISEYVCRIINEMDRNGFRQCTPRNHDAAMQREPFLNLSSGYIQRALAMLPQQGKDKPWRLYQNYLLDVAALRLSSLRDDVLVFSSPPTHGYGYTHATTH